MSLTLTIGRGLAIGSATQAAPTAAPSTLTVVPSKDGTGIGVECSGSGPTVLFVHGGVGDRTRWAAIRATLAPRFTACAMDRRGRGASGDHPDYSLAKEAEDVAAVVNSRGGAVSVFGHSLGGVVALEAAFLTDRISGLMLYEPPLRDPADKSLAVAARLQTLIAKGELEQALIIFQSEVVMQPADELARMKARPSWAELVASIKVHPRQMRALAAYRFDPERARTLTVPTLLLTGGDTASPYAKQSIAALEATLPRATVKVLPGQGHNAMEAGRDVLADAVVAFLARAR
jgi:pimeloyl-ACP methyl ester carboxylesterase